MPYSKQKYREAVGNILYNACYFYFVLLLFQASAPATAQNYNVVIHHTDSTNKLLYPGGIYPEKKFPNQAAALGYIQKVVPALQKQGWLTASVDSLYIHELNYHIFLYTGIQYHWAKLRFDSIPPALLINASINPLQWNNRPVAPTDIAAISEQLLNWCDKNGYPFAKTWLDDIAIENNGQINARLRLDKGKMYYIDSLQVIGNISISKNYLLHYLNISEGSPYNETKLKQISKQLAELPFLQEYIPWSIHFSPYRCTLKMILKEKKANQANAILGFLPNTLQPGKYLLTADMQLNLQNIIGHGESVSISYQNMQQQSPRISTHFLWPYVCNSYASLDTKFDFYRNGLLFRRTTFQAGIRYQVNGADYIRILYQAQSNRLISIDTASILHAHQLPANIDAVSTGIGLELHINKTDYRINPHKGWHININSMIVQRSIKKNAGIAGLKDASGFDFNSLYDTLTKVSYQYHFTGDAACYLPAGRHLTLKAGYAGGYIYSKRIFQNELFMIGGFRLLRGFSELSIFANQYHVITAELRWSLSKNSYAYIFSDNGYVQTRFNNYNREAVYNGIGIGTTLETKTGIFNMAWAIGRSDLIPPRFRESKILFGYMTYF